MGNDGDVGLGCEFGRHAANTVKTAAMTTTRRVAGCMAARDSSGFASEPIHRFRSVMVVCLTPQSSRAPRCLYGLSCGGAYITSSSPIGSGASRRSSRLSNAKRRGSPSSLPDVENQGANSRLGPSLMRGVGTEATLRLRAVLAGTSPASALKGSSAAARFRPANVWPARLPGAAV